MRTATKPLTELTAGDLMSGTVLTIPQHMALRAAARLLAESSVSGAPVVDEEGRCVGVLSGTDFLFWAGKSKRPAGLSTAAPGCLHAAWQMVDIPRLPVEEVAEYMTADPVNVPASTPITDLARMMVDAHIHRVIVVDRQEKPIGIVSSTDILAALAYAGKC